ncbi:MAG: hypothetical protein JXK05_00325 [Campylobacterales bacterium]|nr:hypothetical protein [Campylobacterales bacterium]
MNRVQNYLVHVTALACWLPVALSADFYVIPVAKKTDNLVSVAKSGGQFDDIQKAIDSINDASAEKPYTVYIGPGVYNVTAPITMKANVSLIGSGRDTTMLQGSFGDSEMGPSTALIVGEANASIEHLSIENNNSSTHAFGVYCRGVATHLNDLSIAVAQAAVNWGAYFRDASEVTINRSSIMVQVARTGNVGFYFYNATGSVSHTVISANGSVENKCISLASDSNVSVADSTLTAQGGSENYALYGATAYVTHSVLNGALFGGGARLGWSVFDGHHYVNAQCYECTNASGFPLDLNCSGDSI